MDISIPGFSDPLEALRSGEVRDLKSLVERAGNDDLAAKKFSSLLSTMLVREMRRSLPEGFFGGGAGADTFDGWLDEHLGNALADQDALGLAGMLKASVRSLQERADQAETPEGR